MSKIITNDCVSSLVNTHIGKTDISDIGDGTITGAISGINARADALMKHAFSGVQTNAVLTDALSIDTGNPYGGVGQISNIIIHLINLDLHMMLPM